MLLAEIASQEVFVHLQGKDNNLYTVIIQRTIRVTQFQTIWLKAMYIE